MNGRKFLILVLMLTTLISVCIFQNTLENKNQVATSIADIEVPEEEKPNLSDGFKQYETGLECYMASLEYMKEVKNYEISTNGHITASTMGLNIKQNLRSIQEFYFDGSIFSEDVTMSTSKLAESSSIQAYFDASKDKISVRETNIVKEDLTAEYKQDFTQKTINEYKEKYGYLPNESPYNVSSKTLKREMNFSFDGNEYAFKLIFKASAPTVNYKKKIKNMSGANNYPAFNKCECVIKIDRYG